MLFVHLAALLGLFPGTLALSSLFNGEAYIASPEQHAELDRITAEANKRRGEYAVRLRTRGASSTNLAASINKHQDVSQESLQQASAMVDAAISRWTSTYQKYILDPERNEYSASAAHRRRASPDTTQRLSARDEATFKAAALLAEVEAAERARNGSLHRDYTLLAPESPIQAKPSASTANASFWLEQLAADQHGHAPFSGDPNYKVFRNVKDYGAVGDGVTDDTKAINRAITDGARCGASCASSTTKPAVVYFPSGTYLVSSTIIGYYQTQLIGNPNDRPVIRASSRFLGLDGTAGVISSDVYIQNGGGRKWWLETSNFYRQVRNFVVDIVDMRAENASCFHWQVAQATSIENVACHMSTSASTTQRGIYSENGSGGWMADLQFSGGQVGIYGGEQQFTAVSIQFLGCKTAVKLVWDWGWTWRSIYVSGADVAFQLYDDAKVRGVGSFILQDATISNTKIGVRTLPPKSGARSGTTNIILETVSFDRVGSAVADSNGNALLSGSDLLRVTQVWSQGNNYVQNSTASSRLDTGFSGGAYLQDRVRSPGLIRDASGGSWASKWYRFQRKPQYEDVDIQSFVNAKDYGVKGDGVTDDTQAFKAVFGYVARNGGIVFIPHGVYLLSDTIDVEAGVRVVGECWSQLMAKGSSFSNLPSPKALIRVGQPGGSVGFAEMSDLIITSKGTATDLIGLQWNLRASPSESTIPGMYDVHVRIGGATGSNLQVQQCPKGQGTDCRGAFMMLHISPHGAGYFQNIWAWVADHDIDDGANTQINIIVPRGWLIESTQPTWLYGTASEHAVLYQYSFNGAKTINAGMIQTESAYFQGKSGIRYPEPFGGSVNYPGDPVLPEGGCTSATTGCDESWAVVMLNTTDVVIDGAGLYSWFDGYTQTCIKEQTCQDSLVQVGRGTRDISIRNLITIGSTNMVSGLPGDTTLSIPAGPNLIALGDPWWSVVSDFQIVGSAR